MTIRVRHDDHHVHENHHESCDDHLNDHEKEVVNDVMFWLIRDHDEIGDFENDDHFVLNLLFDDYFLILLHSWPFICLIWH